VPGAMALSLLALLYAGFSGASRRLAGQNKRLLEQTVTEQLLVTDLRRSEERFRSLVRNSDDVNMIVSADGLITYERPAVERVLGYRPDERIGTSGVDMVYPEDRARLQQLFVELVSSPGGQISAEVRALHADGTWRLIEIFGRNLLHEAAVGGVVVNYRDITTRRRLEDELRHQAFHDSLTGLANRALFSDRLEHALSRTGRSRARLAVLFLDLDDFKTVNDSLGHGEGDQLLIAVAARLRETLRSGDTIARMGGDEFAVLVEEPSEAGTAMNYLRLFPINVLKIDGSFVASMSAGPDQRAVVRAIRRLGETLHLSTIAEGIEGAGQLAALRALGASLGQGNFFARALSAEEISVLLSTGDSRARRLSIDRFVA
jgi:PAS domain S-box-containing protein